MSIASAITAAQGRVANCYTSINTKGGTLPAVQNLSNLPAAIESIPSGGGGEYNGLGTKYYKTADLVPYFEIPSGAFEDYTVNYESSSGALGITGYDYVTGKDRGGIYYNGILNWFCNITDDGIATGWTRRDNTNYKTIFLKDAFPSSISQLKIIIKANLTAFSGSGHDVFLATFDSPERYIGLRSRNNFAIYDNGWSNGSTNITKGVWYWYCVTFDGTNTTGYILQDNNYTLDTLPELSQWSQEWTKVSNIWANNKFIFGVNPFSNMEVLVDTSQIDLKNTLIEINNETFYSWEKASPAATITTGILKDTLTDTGSATDYNLYYIGTYELDTSTQENHFGGVVEVPSHTVETPWRPEFTMTGWLNYESGMGFSNFSIDRYIEADYKLNITTDQWASGVIISVHFKTPSRDDYFSSSRMILSSDLEGYYQFNVGYFAVSMMSTSINFKMLNGNSLTIFDMTKYGLTPNTEYWARLVNPTSGDTYLEISTDGTNWTTVTSASVTFKNYAAQRNMKVGVSGAITPDAPAFDGTIYAGDTYIEIGGVKVWNMAATIVPVPPI